MWELSFLWNLQGTPYTAIKVKYTFMKLFTQFREDSLPTGTEIAWEQAKNIWGHFSSDFSMQIVWASPRLEWGLLLLWENAVQNDKWSCRFPGRASVRMFVLVLCGLFFCLLVGLVWGFWGFLFIFWVAI